MLSALCVEMSHLPVWVLGLDILTMLSRASLGSIVLLVGEAFAANFLYNGLAVTPQMGWVSLPFFLIH